MAPVEGRPLAIALSMVLLAVGLSLPMALRLLEGSRRYSTARLARPRPAPPAGRWALVVWGWLGFAVILPVGGIGPGDMAGWWAAGARGFGLGGELYKPGMSAQAVHDRAAQAVAAVRAML
jgi:ABC-type Fe3+ transport system permease subunit